METLSELYRFGKGPSSSHTIGPFRIMKFFISKYKDVDEIKVILYGSLALTGKGHHTDQAILSVTNKIKTNIIFDIKTKCNHPNTMDVIGFKKKKKIAEIRAYSVGGGAIKIEGEKEPKNLNVYPQKNFEEIKKWCLSKKKNLVEYVKYFDPNGFKYLSTVWNVMQSGILKGLKEKESFKKPIKLHRKAHLFLENLKKKKYDKNSVYYTMAYAYAVSEINVIGGEVVTAPTLGSTGIIPAVFYYAKKHKGFKDNKIIEALAVAGVIGNIFKTNGLVAGATGGCQAEIGVACSMAAAGYAYLLGGNINAIETAAIIGIEHHLGLTCDPVLGYVFCPCIERNASVSVRAIDAANQSILTNGIHDVFNLDDIVKVEKKTGEDLKPEYRETSLGGLAKLYTDKYKK